MTDHIPEPAGWEQIQWEQEYQQWLDEYDKGRIADLERDYGHLSQPDEANMNINDAYPSNYLKASDLQGNKIKVVIDHVEMVDFREGKQHKPAIYFMGKEKGMVLNRTNAQVIESAYGPETDNWHGKEIILYSAKVQFQGQLTDALRVELPMPVAEDDDPVPF